MKAKKQSFPQSLPQSPTFCLDLSTINLQDIPPLEQEDAAHVAHEIFSKEFDLDLVRRRLPNSTANLVVRALSKCYMKQMVGGFLALLGVVAVVAAPLRFCELLWTRREARFRRIDVGSVPDCCQACGVLLTEALVLYC